MIYYRIREDIYYEDLKENLNYYQGDVPEVKEEIHEQSSDKNNFRDSRGRLLDGAQIAKKDCCNDVKIILMYGAGMTVKEIVNELGCSKSTVYNVLSKSKNKDKS